MIMSSIFSRLTILVFGSLYPAYASFKTVRARNVQHYVQWMMYWIVFAIFTCIEIFTDIFLFWIPFYYEIKVLFVFWLLSPATNGSSILYRHFVHPLLKRKENKIDDCITQMKQQSCATIMRFGSNGLHQLSALILEMVHFNFRSVLQQPATRVQSYHLLPDRITTTSHEESELQAKEFNIPQLDIEKVEIRSNVIGKTTKKTRKEKCAQNPNAEDNRSIARGRGRRTKTIIVEETK